MTQQRDMQHGGGGGGKKQDKGHYIGMVFLDLQKAFDTVDHRIPLNKLEALGLHKCAIAWFIYMSVSNRWK